MATAASFNPLQTGAHPLVLSKDFPKESTQKLIAVIAIVAAVAATFFTLVNVGLIPAIIFGAGLLLVFLCCARNSDQGSSFKEFADKTVWMKRHGENKQFGLRPSEDKPTTSDDNAKFGGRTVRNESSPPRSNTTTNIPFGGNTGGTGSSTTVAGNKQFGGGRKT